MKKVFGLVVLYNPTHEEYTTSIEKLSSQCDMLIVCNNSDNGFLAQESFKAKVFNFGENFGIAKAQSIGMKWAIQNGADFVLQMDQDSELHQGIVEGLLYCHSQLTNAGYKVGIVGPAFYDKVTKQLAKARLFKGTRIPGTNYDIVSNTGLTHQCLYFEQPHTFEQILFIQTAEPALVGHA